MPTFARSHTLKVLDTSASQRDKSAALFGCGGGCCEPEAESRVPDGTHEVVSGTESSRLRTLPDELRGSRCRNTTSRGTL